MESATEDLCGKWMPRAKDYCARKPDHRGECRTAKALEERRERKTKRRRGVRTSIGHRKAGEGAEARSRWNRTWRLKRYGITQQKFEWLLEFQGFACAMCDEPFGENSVIFVDHDHSCCPDTAKSCGKCVRGLLCLSCNTALGHIERKLRLAEIYLASPPTKLAMNRVA